MKRLVFILALAACLMVAGSSLAQYRNDAVLFSINAGATTATGDDSNESITGNTADFFLEKVLDDGKFAVGISVPYIFADETFENEDGESVDLEFGGVPVLLTAKYNIFNGKFSGYVGAGIGVHSSTLKTGAGTTEETSKTYTGMAFGIPVGIAYFLDDDFYLQAAYNFRSMSGAPISDGLSHSFTLGLGFQWGAE